MQPGFIDSGSNPAPARFEDLEFVFGRIVGVVLGFAGIAFFIMLIFGGFRFITAGSDPAKVEGAKKTLTFAVLGLVFIALAFLFLRLVGAFTGVENIRTFKIVQ